jgi:hypothetical protein
LKKKLLTVLCNYFLQGTRTDKSLEIKTWYDIALLYLRMSQWKDAELCISKIKAISPYSPLTCHAIGDFSSPFYYDCPVLRILASCFFCIISKSSSLIHEAT